MLIYKSKCCSYFINILLIGGGNNVNNFVEIEKFFIFGKNYHMSEQNFLIFEKNYDISGEILLFSEKIIWPEKLIMTCPKHFLSSPPPCRCPFLSKSAPRNRPPPNFLMLPTPLGSIPDSKAPYERTSRLRTTRNLA
jgi:hypothetical protein